MYIRFQIFKTAKILPFLQHKAYKNNNNNSNILDLVLNL